jgi:hypothetical protein
VRPPTMAARLRPLGEERFAWIWLMLAMVCAAVLILWLNRGTTFWVDELSWFMESPSFSLKSALQPHLGHLVLTSHVVYKVIFELFGASYLPFRILAPGTLILTVALFFRYTSRRVGGFVALAPSVLLLFLGSDYLHVLAGNGFTVLGSVACGVGTFLALGREDRRGDAWACALLLLGVVTYSVALGFLFGAAVLILLGEDRRRRAWVFLVPLSIYGAWWIWSRLAFSGPESGTEPLNLLVLPAWAFQSLSAVLSAFTGLSYQFAGAAQAAAVGPVLAVAAIILLGVRLHRGSISRGLWGAIGTVVSLWALGAITAGGIRFPENSRYFYPVGIGLLLVAAESLRGARWPRSGMIALYLVIFSGLGANLHLLRDGGAALRGPFASHVHASFTALDLAGRNAQPTFSLIQADGSPAPGNSALSVPFDIFDGRGDAPVSAYLSAAARYGSLGYSLPALRRQEDGVRAETDGVLAEALGLKLAPASALPRGPGCARVAGNAAAPLPRGGALLMAEDAPASVSLGRFADGQNVPLGELSPSMPALLKIPVDRAPDPWRASAGGGTLIVCPLR